MNTQEVKTGFSNLISFIALAEGVCGIRGEFEKDADGEISLLIGPTAKGLFLSSVSEGIEVDQTKRGGFKEDYYKQILARIVNSVQNAYKNPNIRVLNHAIAQSILDDKHKSETLSQCFKRMSKTMIATVSSPTCTSDVAHEILRRLTKLGIHMSPSSIDDSVPNNLTEAVNNEDVYTQKQKEAIIKLINEECANISQFCLIKRAVKTIK